MKHHWNNRKDLWNATIVGKSVYAIYLYVINRYVLKKSGCVMLVTQTINKLSNF